MQGESSRQSSKRSRDAMSKIDIYSYTAFQAANEKVAECLGSNVSLVAADKITKFVETDFAGIDSMSGDPTQFDPFVMH